MSDMPLFRGPYANTSVPQTYNATNPDPMNKDGMGVTPKGKTASKVSQAQLALQGLIGSRV